MEKFIKNLRVKGDSIIVKHADKTKTMMPLDGNSIVTLSKEIKGTEEAYREYVLAGMDRKLKNAAAAGAAALCYWRLGVNLHNGHYWNAALESGAIYVLADCFLNPVLDDLFKPAMTEIAKTRITVRNAINEGRLVKALGKIG